MFQRILSVVGSRRPIPFSTGTLFHTNRFSAGGWRLPAGSRPALTNVSAPDERRTRKQHCKCPRPRATLRSKRGRNRVGRRRNSFRYGRISGHPSAHSRRAVNATCCFSKNSARSDSRAHVHHQDCDCVHHPGEVRRHAAQICTKDPPALGTSLAYRSSICPCPSYDALPTVYFLSR